jgi:hypothetical protein
MTEGEYTTYEFDVIASHLPTALDIFAHCLISPLLAPGAAEREIHSIQSEFDLAKLSDMQSTQSSFLPLGKLATSSISGVVQRLSLGIQTFPEANISATAFNRACSLAFLSSLSLSLDSCPSC